MEFTVLYWHWLVFGMALIMFEIVLPSFTALWFGLGALVVGGLLLVAPDMRLGWQLFVWTVSSIVATVAWFRYFKPRAVDRTMAGLSRESIIGETGMVIVAASGESRGKLRFSRPILGAEEWDFLCEQTIAVGDRVRVVELSGNALIVVKS